MGEVLGKLAVRSLSEPRGPDVVHSISVPADWLVAGKTIEVELPRNLSCANCEGGGCDACERAGAVSLRAKRDPVELVQVSLPERGADVGEDAQTLVLRIPDHGGHASTPGVPRGLLLLRVSVAATADPGVVLSLAPPPPLADPSVHPNRAPKELVRLSLIVGVCLVILFLLMLRFSGWL